MNANWTRFNKYLYKYWKFQIAVILLGVVTVPLGLINPYLTKLVIDKAYDNKDLRLFLILAAIGASIFILNGLITSLKNYLSQYINRNINFDMTKNLFKHIQHLSLSFFNNRSSGEHIYRINSDVRLVSDFVCNTIPQIIILFPRLLFILIIVFYLNWRLALFATLLVPISYIQPYFFSKWLREIARRMIEKSQGIFERLDEVFSHIRLIKTFGKENYEIKRFEESLAKRINFEIKRTKLSSIGGFSGSVLNKVISGAIALYGGYQVIKGTTTLGSLAAVMIYLTQLIGLMRSIGNFYETITINSVSRKRLSEILDIKPEIIDAEGAVDYHILQGKIEFKNVYFGYKSSPCTQGLDKKNASILENITFSIEPRSKIALVGPSGCGKTTLLSLILRLYDVKDGSISIDGLDIKDIKLNSLKTQIGMALQEPLLWNDTIANNILYGAENSDKEDMVKAAKIACAHEFIMKLPRQYETVIGEMGCRISEGQKQRIAIARAVIKRPKILILDEAMSSVDSETEERIIDNIKHESRDATIIIVSHRFSAVKKMDLIYFLQGPSSMTLSNHKELSRNPKYNELFAGQIQKMMESEAVVGKK